MKIKSIEIIGFGKLTNYKMDFDNFTSICENNGYGKSTIVAFIKAMLYGLETIKDTSKQFLDRKHYYPYSGTKFGGNITFEINDNEIIIERFFDKKSITKDTLKVFLNKTETKEYGDDIGKKLFGISKENFERFIIINSEKINISTDSDINSKLNNYVQNVGEEFDYDKLYGKLDKLNKSLEKEIKEKKSNIDCIKEEIKTLEGIENNLIEKERIFEKSKEEIENINSKLTISRNSAVIAEKIKHVEYIESNINDMKQNLDAIINKYPNNIPSVEKINEIIELKKRLESYEKTNSDSERFFQSNNAELVSLDNLFKDKKPSNEELDLLDKKIDEYNKLNIDLNSLNNKLSENEKNSLRKKFSGNSDLKNEYERINSEIQQLNKIEQNTTCSPINPDIREDSNNKKNNKIIFISSIILSIVLLAVGIGIIFNYLIPGIVLIALSIICFVVSMVIVFYLRIKNLSKSTIQSIGSLSKNKEKELDIRMKLAQFGYIDNNISFILLFNNFKNDLDKYFEIENDDKIITEKNNNISNLSKEFDSYFSQFGINSKSYNEARDALKKEIMKYDYLNEKRDEFNNNMSCNMVYISEISKEIDEFYNEYSLTKDYLIESIKEDILQIMRLKDEISKNNNNKEEFIISNNLQEIKVDEINNKVDNNLEQLYTEKLNYYNQMLIEINDLTGQIAPLKEKKAELEQLNNELFYIKNKNKIYTEFINQLEIADQELKDKYVEPIRKRFCEYAKLLEETIGENVRMDKNYNIYFNREGEFRSCEHLSTGNLQICALCFRLALIDSLFAEEKPFIIMDDPFMALDKGHIEKAKQLVLDLSKNTQIIYLSCHESRTF